MREVVGKVTDNEKEEIMILNEKKIALDNLKKVCDDKCTLNNIETSLKNIQYSMEKWWKYKAEKYNWKGTSEGHWEVSFSDGTITLV